MEKINFKKLDIPGARVASDPEGIEYLSSDPIPSRLDPLDLILGGGFLPGRVYLLSGEKSSGKSTLLNQSMIGIQEIGGLCAHAESENTLDLERAKALGTDLGALVISSESIQTLEGGFEWLKDTMLAIKKAYPTIPVMLSWDTFQSTITKAQMASTITGKGGIDDLRKEMDPFAGGQQEEARVIKTKLKELVHLLNRNQAFLVLLSQVYDNREMFGSDKLVTSGGHGLHHQVSAHIRVVQKSKIYDPSYEKMVIGNVVNISTVKNKQAPPYLNFDIPLFYSTGFSAGKAVHDYCIQNRLIGGGSWTTIVAPFGDKSFPKIQLRSLFGTYYKGMENYGIYHWMVILIYRFLAEMFPSLTERYLRLAQEREDLIRGLLEEGKMTLKP